MTNTTIKCTVCFEYYTPELCKANPNKLWLFGDNLIGIGSGGQAVIRNESNVFGIPTKVFPLKGDFVFLHDREPLYMRYMTQYYDNIFAELVEHAATHEYEEIVFPAAGLGTGLSKMDLYAPQLLGYIDTEVSRLLGEDYTTFR